jgi:hypothetical protein
MSQLNNANFEALYNNPSGGSFPTNTDQEIGSNDLRQFAKDIADSYLNLTDAAYNGPRGLKSIAQTLAAFKAIPTATIELGVTVIWTDINAFGGQFRICRLYTGVESADEKIIIPDDYATTGKFWYVLFNSQRHFTAGAMWNEIYSIADLKALPTDDIDDILEGTKVFFKATTGGTLECYQLEIGTNTESSPMIILPNDYHAVDNQKFWKRAIIAESTTPDVNYVEYSDFIASGLINGFSSVVVGSGANVTPEGLYGIDSTEKALGVLSLESGTSTTGLGSMYKALSKLKFGLGHTIKLEFRASLETLSDGTDTYDAYLGFGEDEQDLNHDNGAYFKYTHGTNSGRWQAVTANAGVRTATDSTVAANTVYRTFSIEVNAGGTNVSFSVDGVVVANTTNIPTANFTGIVFKIVKSAGTTSRQLHLDWYKLTITRTSAR